MSAVNDNTEVPAADGCAFCGVAEIDEIKLKECDGGCDLVRYCSDSDECQQDDRQTHEAVCKERVAELRDEMLFRQPEESHLGDCPICCLPLPLEHRKNVIYSCCSKLCCKGCEHSNKIREIEQQLKKRCPFCRKVISKTDKEIEANDKKRVAANDPIAICDMGNELYHKGDYERALKYLSMAAEFGDADAHFDLSLLYHKGLGVEKDDKMEIYHLEEAAISGHPGARYWLGCWEWDSKRFDRAVKHWIIASNLGDDKSIHELKKCYKDGHISKDDFASALRAHQAAVDAMKSPQREAAGAINIKAAVTK